MLEYGYALRARSLSVMIPVMNTAYGDAEELPFDKRLVANLYAAAVEESAHQPAPRYGATGEFVRRLAPPRPTGWLVASMSRQRFGACIVA